MESHTDDDTATDSEDDVPDDGEPASNDIDVTIDEEEPASHDIDVSVDEEDPAPHDIDVSVDGTWMTRGYSSKVGVTTVLGQVTGKVLDTQVKSKVCKSCDFWAKNKDKRPEAYREWLRTHPPNCDATHGGSSGAMEASSGIDMFARSEEKYNLRYTRFTGDGDTNAYKSVSESRPYGDTVIEKIECVGHVQKRMGTRLRKLKTTLGKNKLKDGKTIGGRGRLTATQIDQIQTYYGNAIRGNKNDATSMREAIWAIFRHKSSTDKKPQHNLCKETWCKYLQMQTDKTIKNPHSHSMPQAVMDAIKPIFIDLTSPELLNKCLEGYTQNANESINQLIWKYCPKNQYHGVKTVSTAVGLAVIIYNDGSKSIASVFERLGISVGNFCRTYLCTRDSQRIDKADIRATEASLEYRRAKRQERLAADEAVEDGAYSCGGH